MTVKLLAEHQLEFLSLKGGCAHSSESTLVKIPHCWKSHVTANFIFHQMAQVTEEYNVDVNTGKKGLGIQIHVLYASDRGFNFH